MSNEFKVVKKLENDSKPIIFSSGDSNADYLWLMVNGGFEARVIDEKLKSAS